MGGIVEFPTWHLAPLKIGPVELPLKIEILSLKAGDRVEIAFSEFRLYPVALLPVLATITEHALEKVQEPSPKTFEDAFHQLYDRVDQARHQHDDENQHQDQQSHDRQWIDLNEFPDLPRGTAWLRLCRCRLFEVIEPCFPFVTLLSGVAVRIDVISGPFTFETVRVVIDRFFAELAVSFDYAQHVRQVDIVGRLRGTLFIKKFFESSHNGSILLADLGVGAAARGAHRGTGEHHVFCKWKKKS